MAGDRRTCVPAPPALPFPDASFDVAVACLVFEHIEQVDEAIAEVARVLEPGGRFLFFLNHPLLQTPNSGWIDDQILDPPEQYWRIGAYLREDSSIEEVQKDVFIPFIHRPMNRYVNALIANGLLLTRMEEPAPPPGFLAGRRSTPTPPRSPACCSCARRSCAESRALTPPPTTAVRSQPHPRGKPAMPIFMVERRFADELDAGADEIDGINRINEEEGVRWLYSFLSADKRKTYCLYEAPSPEAILRAAERAGLPADVIVEVTDRLTPDGAATPL